MSGSINTSWLISILVETFIFIYAARKSVANAMESTITVEKYPIGSVLKHVQRLWNSVSGWEAGKSTL